MGDDRLQYMTGIMCFCFMGQKEEESTFSSTRWSLARGPCQQHLAANRIKLSTSKKTISSLLFCSRFMNLLLHRFDESVPFANPTQLNYQRPIQEYMPSPSVSLSRRTASQALTRSLFQFLDTCFNMSLMNNATTSCTWVNLLKHQVVNVFTHPAENR